MPKIVPLFLFLFCSYKLYSQDLLSTQAETHAHADRVMQAMENADFPKAFELIKRFWPMPESEIDALEEQTSSQIEGVASRFGEIIGFEFIGNKQIKDFALQKTYVLKFEKHMIRVLFTYYQNKEGWLLNGFSWDDRFYELFE